MSRFNPSPIYKLQNDIEEQIMNLEKFRLGKVLTIIDGAFTDPVQRKAVKDLVKDAFYSREFYTKIIAEKLFEFKEEQLPDMPMEEWEKESWERMRPKAVGIN